MRTTGTRIEGIPLVVGRPDRLGGTTVSRGIALDFDAIFLHTVVQAAPAVCIWRPWVVLSGSPPAR